MALLIGQSSQAARDKRPTTVGVCVRGTSDPTATSARQAAVGSGVAPSTGGEDGANPILHVSMWAGDQGWSVCVQNQVTAPRPLTLPQAR